jgi:hypothetical protein
MKKIIILLLGLSFALSCGQMDDVYREYADAALGNLKVCFQGSARSVGQRDNGNQRNENKESIEQDLSGF